MGRATTTVDRTRWPRGLFLVLSLWPLVTAVHAWADKSRSTMDLIAILFVITALGVLYLGPRRVLGAVRVWLTVTLLSAAYFLALRRMPIEVFLLLTSVTCLLGGLCLFDAGRKRTASLAFAIVIFALFLAAVEASFFYVRPSLSNISAAKEGTIEEPDDRMSIRLIPGARARRTVTRGNGQTEIDVTYHIDTDGTRHVPTRPQLGPQWYFFGGSQTFGFSVDDEDTIPSLIQTQNPSCRVYNYGVNGFGAADVYLYLRRAAADQQDLSLCVYLMMDDHFRRAACPDSLTAQVWGSDKPRFRLVSGELEYFGRAYDTLSGLRQLHVDTMTRSWVYRKLFGSWSIDSDSTQLVHAMIVQMKEATESLPNCNFVLVLFPQYSRGAPVFYELDEWKAKLDQRGVFILDLRGRFYEHLNAHGLTQMDYFYVDYHPRPAFDELMADWITAYLRTIPHGKGAEG